MKRHAWLAPAIRSILFLTLAILVCPSRTIAGMTSSEVQAVLEFVKKADQGDPAAQFQLGLCYAKGQGVEKDLARACMWYRKAAAQGYYEAQFGLALCYGRGEGVARDDVEACAYLSLAAFEFQDARKELVALKGKLTPNQIAAVRARVSALSKEIGIKAGGR